MIAFIGRGLFPILNLGLPEFGHAGGCRTQPQPQLSPRNARRPSMIRTGVAARAAMESIQPMWKAALMPRPIRVMPARYAQVADCTASAARARLSVVFAVLRLSQASAGITMSAAIVIAIPAGLVRGRIPATRAVSAATATTPARAKSRRPAQRAERVLLSANAGRNDINATAAERSSTRLSAPKASSAML